VSGYGQQELDDIQQRWKVRFPADLIDIYRKRRSVIDNGFDWVKTPGAEIQRMMDAPLEGILFDVRENAFWLSEWGEKPKSNAAAEEIVRAAVAAAPRLIPVYSHRYLPETPFGRGNPVFSVVQTDIIVYGPNLDLYVAQEMHGTSRAIAARRIPFWTQLTET
jgi:hypothetical protein